MRLLSRSCNVDFVADRLATVVEENGAQRRRSGSRCHRQHRGGAAGYDADLVRDQHGQLPGEIFRSV